MDRRRQADCRCGTRVARDNETGVCQRCRRWEAARLVTPPRVPAGFWHTEAFRSAFAQRHIGKVIRVYRHHPFHGRSPLPQDMVAGWMGQTQAQLSRLENGPPMRDLGRLTAWAALLGMPPEFLWFALPGAQPPVAVGAIGGEGPGRPQLPLIEALRVADRQVGGAHLYATANVRLTAHQPRHGDAAAAAAVASLHEVAGWMALDAGSGHTARRHLADAARLASDSGDAQLSAQTFASLSHHARQAGNATDATKYAYNGLKALQSGPPHGHLEGRLLAMQACALAAGGRPIDALRALSEAERAFAREPGQASPWLSPFDEASLTMEAARCLLQIGDFCQAEERLRTVLTRRRGDRVRSRAIADLLLVTVLLARGCLDEACERVDDAVNRTTALGSAVVLEQLRHVSVLLRSHAARSASVKPVLGRLHDAVRVRAWIGSVAPADSRGSD